MKPFSVGKVRDIYELGRRHAAVRHVGPHVGLRRGDGRTDPRQGPGPHGHHRLLGGAAGRRWRPTIWSAWRCPPARPMATTAATWTGGSWWSGGPRCCRSSASCGATCPARRGRSTAGRQTMHGQPLPAGHAPVRPAARAGVHPLDQGHVRPRREHLLRRGGRPRRRRTSPRQARDICLGGLRQQGAALGGRAGDHHRRHQVRARLDRRPAGHLRRGPHARLVAVLAGRPVGAGQRAAVVRQAAAPRLAGGHRVGQDAAAAGRCPTRWSRRPGTATSRPTSASPGPRFADWPGAGRALMSRSRCWSRSPCGPGSPTRRAPPSNGPCPPSASTPVHGVRAGKAIRFVVDADDEAAARAERRRSVPALADQPGDRGRRWSPWRPQPMTASVGVVLFPGTNCEHDVVEAVDRSRRRTLGSSGTATDDLGGVDAVVLPGGFAHGDYLRPGAIARFSPIMTAVARLRRGRRPGRRHLQRLSGPDRSRTCCPARCRRTRGLTFLCVTAEVEVVIDRHRC